MSYLEPIDTRLVEAVIDDLEDCNAHTICELLMAHYGFRGAVPEDVADRAYDAAKEIFHAYRLDKSRSRANA